MNLHEERSKGIGGSDVEPILFGTGYRNHFQVYNEKIGIADPQEDTPHTRRGNEDEPRILDYFKSEYMPEDSTLERTPPVKYHEQYPELLCHADALEYSAEGLYIIECKSCLDPRVIQTLDDADDLWKIPKFQHWYYQIQHMLYCYPNAVACKLLIKDADPHRFEYWSPLIINPNPKIQAAMIPRLRKFWQYVVTKTPPNDWQEFEIQYPDDVEEYMPDHLNNLALSILEEQNIIKEHNDRKDKLTDLFLQEAQNAKTLLGTGVKAVRIVGTRGTLNKDAIKANYPDVDLDKCKSTSKFDYFRFYETR